MKILLKKILIADKKSIYNNLLKDILIDDGKIVAIEEQINVNADFIVDEQDIIASVGWVDIFSNFNDPGFEYKETLETGSASAIAGGYTTVFSLPNTNPAVCSKSQIEYIVQKSKQLLIQVLPYGSISKNIEGKELSEMYDMNNSGAVAFSDALLPIQSSGLLLKALQYVKAFNGTIVQLPIDKSIAAHGLINEGIVSTQLGLPGLPKLAEISIIKRDIDLLRYTNSKLHITGITTAESIDLIKSAKQEGLQISCSVTPYHLLFCDEDLIEYDTNLKVNPPLRTQQDVNAIRKAIEEGIVDCIASHHLPQNSDAKDCEFEYAKNGMIGLQTAYAIVNTVLPNLSNEEVCNIFNSNAINIFGLKKASININEDADITLFKRNGNSILTKENNKSKSLNSPLLNKELRGKVFGIIYKGILTKN